MSAVTILAALMRYYDHKYPGSRGLVRARYQVQAAIVISDMMAAGLMEGLDG